MVSPCFLDINYRMKYLLKDSDFIYGELDCNEGEIPKNVRVKIIDKDNIKNCKYLDKERAKDLVIF